MITGGGAAKGLTHMCVSILPQTPLPSRLPDDMGQSQMVLLSEARWAAIRARATEADRSDYFKRFKDC